MFCGCANEFGGAPNTRTCPVCLGLPGSLPTMNRQAVQLVLRTALALNCEISRDCLFARKNYFYPDLPKGYQISQYENPIGMKGWLDITLEDGQHETHVHIRRVHLEEDTGKLIHAGGNESEVDYNRSGVPLMEIVTEFPPDICFGGRGPRLLGEAAVDSYLSRRLGRQNGGGASARRAEFELSDPSALRVSGSRPRSRI